MADKKGFYWERHAEVEELFLKHLARLCGESATLARFAAKLGKRTSTGLLAWVDHLILADTAAQRDELQGLGFVPEPGAGAAGFSHPGVLLPAVVLAGESLRPVQGVALRVESIASFLQANGLKAVIEGQPLSPYRRAKLPLENGAVLLAVERRGTRDFVPASPGEAYERDYLEAVEAWQLLPRAGDDEDRALTEILATAEHLVARLGRDTAAHLVCSCERSYWLTRNHAARVQKGRQDSLGLGWANHDHHTFRSSRRHFAKLIGLFRSLGFRRRERFYAGKEAGWGAQLMESTAAGLVLFLDVDLEPGEVSIDFSQAALGENDRLGTVGLWCALHGDSILAAGMHHLAARFEFDRLREDLAPLGVKLMAPFSDFPYLRQAFSMAESWEVAPSRLAALLERQAITPEQAERFRRQGAVGSHLENIERREGYKGFNRKNVSAIIRETDPRK